MIGEVNNQQANYKKWPDEIAPLRASMAVIYFIELFRTGADRHHGILMSLLLLVPETIILQSVS